MVSRKKLKSKIQNLKSKIGLFGGTFNPIHIGHIKMAKVALKQFKLDKIYFIPAGVPPHKPKKGLLPAKLRYRLVKKVINKLNQEPKTKNQKPFGVLDIEIKKKTKCYTIDTIKKIRQQTIDNRQQATDNRQQIFFLIGEDEFTKLHTWKKANELAKLVTFIVLPRMTQDTRRKTQNMSHVICPKVKHLKWHLLKTRPIDISSTEIRKNLGHNIP